MKKNVTALLLALSGAALLAGGCAKKEMVQAEQPLAPSATASAAAPQSSSTVPAQSESASAVIQEPAPEKRVSEEALQPLPDAGKLSGLQQIYFGFDRYTLSPEARETLVQHAEQLKKQGEVKVQIAGHCDERGSNGYNLALSERRARAAKQYLVSLGIPSERLTVIGYGEEKPAALGHDEASWTENRRDEFVIAQ